MSSSVLNSSSKTSSINGLEGTSVSENTSGVATVGGGGEADGANLRAAAIVSFLAQANYCRLRDEERTSSPDNSRNGRVATRHDPTDLQ